MKTLHSGIITFLFLLSAEEGATQTPPGYPGGPGPAVAAPHSPPPPGAYPHGSNLGNPGNAPQMAGWARYGGGKTPGTPAIVRFSKGGSLKVEDLEEDLKVMSVLLQKNLERSVDSPRTPYRMGIPMLFQSSFIEATYLEGFGVLFQQTVNFPLVAPAVPENQAKEPTPGTDWEAARRELYGWPNNQSWGGQHGYQGPESEYHPEQVEALQKEILETLKQAANIRELDPKDFIAVSISGPASFRMNMAGGAGARHDPHEKPARTASAAPFSPAGSSENRPGVIPGEQQTRRNPPPEKPFPSSPDSPLQGIGGKSTILTVRVKKADADAFSKGNLSFDAFKEKATIQAYFAGSSGSSHPMPGSRAR